MTRLRQLLAVTILLAFGVVPLGAYVRLSDAGLGCPDWPGCYGRYLDLPTSAPDVAQWPGSAKAGSFEAGKAWKEMIHRYAAATLGMLISALALMCWRRGVASRLAASLVALIVIQGLLGMWTVTGLLAPAIITAHLFGGMATLALLVALHCALAPPPQDVLVLSGGARVFAVAALAAVSVQIVLGGWVSSHGAGLACVDFPTCNGRWLPMLPPHAWHLVAEANVADFAPNGADLVTIHGIHRLGALVVALTVGALIATLWRRQARRAATLLTVLLTVQLALGILNVMLRLPLPLAVAHNLGAAGLLATLVALNVRLRPSP